LPFFQPAGAAQIILEIAFRLARPTGPPVRLARPEPFG